MQDEDKEKAGYRALRLRWPVDGGPAAFANNIVVQADELGRVFITFFQANPPMVVGTTSDSEGKLTSEGIEYVDARPVARVVVSKSEALELVKLINRVTGENHGSERS